ncbi:hypothetical protein AAMO2058_001438000 [Amorphochlora amoebiformis]
MLVFSLLFFNLVGFARGDDISCASKGFAESLVCSSCTKLQQIVQDQALVDECLSCCQTDKEELTQKFSSGRLEVCN